MTTETLNLKDASLLLNMHPQTVREKTLSHEIPGAKPGKCWVFIKEDLLNWLRSQYPINLQNVGQGGTTCSLKEKTVHTGGITLQHQTDEEYDNLLKLPIKGKHRS